MSFIRATSEMRRALVELSASGCPGLPAPLRSLLQGRNGLFHGNHRDGERVVPWRELRGELENRIGLVRLNEDVAASRVDPFDEHLDGVTSRRRPFGKHFKHRGKVAAVLGGGTVEPMLVLSHELHDDPPDRLSATVAPAGGEVNEWLPDVPCWVDARGNAYPRH